MKCGNIQYSERKQTGKENFKRKRKGGSHVLGRKLLVDNTLRVGCQYRIVLRFMGTVEESLMTGQYWTRVWYMGCGVGVDWSEGAVERDTG